MPLTKADKDFIEGRLSWVRSELDEVVRDVQRLQAALRDLENRMRHGRKKAKEMSHD